MTRYAQIDKIKCRRCWCGQSTVVNTIVNDVMYGGKKRTVIKRRRQCRHCKFIWTTVEIEEESLLDPAVQQALGAIPTVEENLEDISPMASEAPATPPNPFLAAGRDTSPIENRRPQRRKK